MLLLCLAIILITSACSDDAVDFDNIGMTAEGVFQSLESIFEIFQKPEYKNMPQVISVLSVFDSCAEFYNVNKYHHTSTRNVFVVIEGLQASGSRYFATRLVKSMKAQYLISPPACLYPFRKFFDQQNIILRSAFYALGNYILAEQVKRTYFHQPVIINRYWHSQTAITLSHQAVVNVDTMLPLRQSPVYQWPKDLLMPDLVLFLSNQHNIHNPVWNENRLVMTKYFRTLMIEAYLRMREPSLVDVDGGKFETRTYATMRMLINNTQNNLMECYRKYNLTSRIRVTKNPNTFRLKYKAIH